MDPQRMIERLDAMVESGRITPEEATRLRASGGTEEFDRVVAEIRARHATAHAETSVGDGRMSQEEADGLLARVRQGEHSAELRKQIRAKQ
jgi:polyhydroxyalkanoate synthesis regulator phasin